MKRIVYIIIVLVLSLYNTALLAQEQYKVVGKVCTKDGEALIGADVRENGTGNYTETDVDGKFILYVSSKDAVVKISSIGFKEILLPADYDFSNITIYKYYKDRRWHMNFYASQSTIMSTKDDFPDLKNSIGVGFSFGKTFLFKRKPGYHIAKYGIIADFLNINSNLYEITDKYYWGVEDGKEIEETYTGVQMGPTVVITPIRKLNIQLSAKFAFGYNSLVIDYDTYSDFNGASGGFSLGVDISYGIIGFGVEYRIQSVKYDVEYDRIISNGVVYDYNYDIYDKIGIGEGKFKTNMLRAYLSIKL